MISTAQRIRMALPATTVELAAQLSLPTNYLRAELTRMRRLGQVHNTGLRVAHTHGHNNGQPPFIWDVV